MSLFWLRAAGLYAIGFGLFHIAFWKIFRWKGDLSKIQPINRGIMQVMNLCLIYLFLAIMGWTAIAYAAEFQATHLGHMLMWLFAGFWFYRAILQIVFFRRKSLISWIYTIIFLLGALINGIAAL